MTLDLDKLNQDIFNQSLANLPDNEREFTKQVNEFKAWCIDCIEAETKAIVSKYAKLQAERITELYEKYVDNKRCEV